MIWNNEKRRKMEFIKHYIPTSKAQLLQMAMYLSDGDMKRAQELFDFYNKNLNLPDFDPVPPSFFQQAKDTAGGFMAFIKENKDDLLNGYQVVSTLIQNRGILPAAFTGAGEAEEPLEDIN